MRYVGIFLVVFLSRSVIPSYSSTETDGNQQSEGYFHCDDNRSLEFAQYCDKEVDCADKTDERDCDYDACTLEASRKFRCKNNRKCVLSDFVCDGVFDCPDRSDESDCGNKTKKAYCHDGWFACKDSSHCVPATYRCDGYPECSDKSDEKDCHNILHGVLACVDKFKCMDATCLADDKFVCDGTKDCANGLDESDETCRSHPDCKDCKDICVRHEHGVTCSCRSGFEFGDDKVTCQDIDECKLNFCSQNCENTPGSFVCSCEPGYNLVNGTKCESLTKPTYVWYRGVRGSRAEIIVDRDGRTRKIRLPPSKTHVPNIIIPPMDIDIYNEKLYFRSKNLLFELDMKYPTHAPRRIALPDVDLTHFAIDFATGNVYFTKDAGTKISVCQPEHSCASLISDRSSEISGLRIAHLINGSRLFWTEGSSTIMSSSLDGLQVSKVYQTSRRQRLSYYLVDPRSNKLYVAHNYLVEVDLSSLRTRKVTKIEFANSTQLLWNMAVDDDTLLLQIPEWKFQGAQNWKFIVYKIDLRTGDHIGHMKTRGDLILHSVHRPSEIRPQNPCHASLCSHTCVSGTSPRWFKCLCPPGMILDEDDERNCVVKQNQELIYFVNGSLFSTYVYENELLSLSSILDIQDQPLAITADSDMGLIYSTHRGLYLLTAEGRTKEIGSNLRDIRSLAYDYLDNVLYAVDNLELLAINLKTSAIALIETNTNVVNLDIDVKNRVLFVETRDSKLSSMIIGNWEYIFFNRIIHPTHDIQKNWVFDPYEIKIRLNSSIVLNNGFCDLSHDGEIGFACQPHSKLLPRCDHSDHETRLLAVFTPRSDSSKSKRKTACDSVSCNFCVSDPDNQAVCMCPYGHEIGADGKSCTETCGAQMLRCNAPKDKCIHKSKKCDGFDDCSDGSDEKNCDEHNCGDNFKCASNNVCIMRKYRCDGQNDCTDGSDEKNCPFRNCTSSQFQCKDQSCIDLTKKCDGEDDCLFGEDEEKCPEVICKKDEFDCGNRKCIPKDWQCDDNIDCPSGIDELNCSSIPHEIQSSHKKKKCDSNWNFCCGSGELLSLELRCNGAEECNDGSDEHNCTLACASPNFRCKDGQCLTERQVCDGISDCSDADDERNCRNRCQQKDLFECISDGKCVPRGVVCDGRKDCSDASDESEDICPPPTTEKPSCFAGDFKCDSGQCIEFSQVCDGVSQCADGSDEGVHCPAKLNCQRAGCSHSCYLSGSEVRCSCPAGFRLSEGGLSCVDIDECLEIPAKCSQKCHNLKGSYSCSCAPGFRLNFKGECRVESGEPVILVVDNEVVETVSENNDRRIVFDAQNSHIGGVEYDHVSELVFVSDTNNNKVHRIPLNNLNPGFKHEVYTQVKPGVLALDYVTDNLYYADYRPSIHVCTRAMAGAYCTMLTEVNFKPEPGLPAPEILSLVVVPLEGIMFYSESETGFIFRVNMDGSNKSTFAWPSREKKPLSLTVDHVRKTLYWIDAHSGFIEHSDFEGGNIRRLPQRWGYWQTFALFEDYLYIPEPYRHQWIIMHKITGKIKSSMASLRGRLTDIKIMHRVNQPPGENRCSAKKCQQICLLRPNGSTCACKDGQRLAADNVSCTEVDFNWGELHDQHWASKLKEECSCENGGKCTVSSMMNRQFFCKCPPGFHGERCEFGATKSLVLTVVMVALVFTLVAIAGILLIIIVAKRDRISRHFRRQTCQGGDKRNLIVEGNEDENLY